ncbi:MAG: MFS transporter [Anaerolineaceae bacterium]|nr:MFS transporter [Anaerolineaceae bacterium]
MTDHSPSDLVVSRAQVPWRKWVEPWYFSYALLGVMLAGLAPILLPLAISRSGSPAEVGLVMAAFNLGGLAAPLWGGLADRYRLHRLLLIAGLLLAAAGMALFAFSQSASAWLVLAVIQGVGVAAASTVANLFIVEQHDRAEWDVRIGWLQTFYGSGQVIGLLAAGILSRSNLRVGLLVAAGVAALAAVLGWLTTHTPPKQLEPRPVLLHPVQHGEWAINSPQRLYHLINLKGLKQFGTVRRSSFGLFTLLWFISFAGAAGVFSLFPIWMEKVYAVNTTVSSTGFALAAGLGLALYSPSGSWTRRFGAGPVLRAGLGVRLLAFLGLLVLGISGLALGWLALVLFMLIVVAWSPITVSGTDWAARLSTIGEGEGLGIFNASTAVAGVAGSVLGGWAAGQWGYPAVSVLGAAGVVIGLVLSTRMPKTD